MTTNANAVPKANRAFLYLVEITITTIAIARKCPLGMIGQYGLVMINNEKEKSASLPRRDSDSLRRIADPAMEGRFVDLQKRLKASAIYPAPVVLLPDFVKHGLGKDPLRAGHAGAAAMWTGEDDGDARFKEKLRADLLDLAALKAEILDASEDVVQEQQAEA